MKSSISQKKKIGGIISELEDKKNSDVLENSDELKEKNEEVWKEHARFMGHP
jgi:hypothetical protein